MYHKLMFFKKNPLLKVKCGYFLFILDTSFELNLSTSKLIIYTFRRNVHHSNILFAAINMKYKVYYIYSL